MPDLLELADVLWGGRQGQQARTLAGDRPLRTLEARLKVPRPQRSLEGLEGREGYGILLS